ncbi:hypothetical protein D1818_23855 [Aquimarina sp. BL5]|uniref:hypothetical protein n=1 Tax=Aquimarina sp. BL5 TaxID=1714860 RepID=UPI000E469BDF|nr:hypothetical protein [Aquimarina sp. BL5]AXT53712.1 hypothetical protein D1818_23855 [Aquimarina sp. BL5]RKN06777.1 hypothetical protein D7036_08565 [Aquimarina sp. BL5]
MDYISYSSELFKNIDWDFIWSILRDIVLPNSGALIFNIIIFLFLGFIIGIIYCIVLWRKGIFKRAPKYYNWAVKLYIPLLIVGILYVFGQWGFIRGIYKILDNEKTIIVKGIYNGSVQQIFESEYAKNKFVLSAQMLAIKAKSDSQDYAVFFKKHLKNYDTGSSFLNKTKNKLSKFIVNNYSDDLYKLTMYALITSAGKGHIDFSEALPYEEFNAAMDLLLEVGYQDIEKVVLEKLSQWFSMGITAQYHGMVKSLLILLFLILIVPLLEYFIYKKWIAPKYIPKTT